MDGSNPSVGSVFVFFVVNCDWNYPSTHFSFGLCYILFSSNVIPNINKINNIFFYCCQKPK